MGIGWVDTVYNNSDKIIKIRSIDECHNGTLKNKNDGNDHFDLHDGDFHELKPQSKYTAEWFGIPWYCQGKHFKTYTADCTINFYMSNIGRQSYIRFVKDSNGQELVRIKVPSGCNFNCNMRFENDGVWIDIVHNHSFSTEYERGNLYNASMEWAEVGVSVAARAISAFS